MRTRILASAALIATSLAAFAGTASADPPPAPYSNGFENPGDAGPNDNEALVGATRVASGTNGVASADGGWHAVTNGGEFTRFGGYSDTFPDGGFVTSLDMYLDPSMSAVAADVRLDWSVAISHANGSHRRDFMFHIGTDGAGGFVASASNNSPGWPANPGRDPVYFPGGGWHTLQHSFYDAGGGVLAVDLTLFDAGGTALNTWTLSDPTDIIGTTVGGNRYGWLVNSGFSDLPFDNLSRSGMTAQDMKAAVADDLAALLPTGDDGDDKAIEKAIDAIGKSLAAEYWIDGSTPDSKKVFDEEKKAVKELSKVDTVDVSAAIATLVDLDRGFAMDAIAAAEQALADAGCPDGSKECDKAQKELDKADDEMGKSDDELAEGDYDKAIDKAKKAWEKAMKAIDQLD